MNDVGFWSVIFVQCVWFALTTYLRGNSRSLFSFLMSGLALGVPYGMAVDSFVGFRAEIFDYQGLEQSLLFIALNAAFSYGLAIGTMFNFTASLGKMPEVDRRLSYLFFLVASIALFLHSRFGGHATLLDMFLLGAVILLIADLALILYSMRSVLLGSLLAPKSFCQLFLFCALTGVVYETANYFATLWFWRNEFPTVEVNLILIVLFGYFVLLFPMLVLAHFFSSILSAFER